MDFLIGIINFFATLFQIIEAILRIAGWAGSGARHANEAIQAGRKRTAAHPRSSATERALNAACWLLLAAGCTGAYLYGCSEGSSHQATSPTIVVPEESSPSRETLPELAIGESTFIDARGAVAALADIPSQEIDDQMLDWAVSGLAERWPRAKPAADDTAVPPVRLDDLRDALSFQYGDARHVVVGGDALLLYAKAAKGAEASEQVALAEAADALRATSGRTYDRYRRFSAKPERRGDALTGRIVVTREPDVSRETIFGAEHGYHECEASDGTQLAACLKQIDDLTFLQTGATSLKLGGRAFKAGSVRKLSVEDIATLLYGKTEVYSLEPRWTTNTKKLVNRLRSAPCSGLRELSAKVALQGRSADVVADASGWLQQHAGACPIRGEVVTRDLMLDGKVRAERNLAAPLGPKDPELKPTYRAWFRAATHLLAAIDRAQCVTRLPRPSSTAPRWRPVELSMVYADLVAKQWLTGALLDGMPSPWVALPTADGAMPTEADALSMWIAFDPQSSASSRDGAGGAYFRRWAVSAFVEADTISTAADRTSSIGHRLGWWARNYSRIAERDSEFALLNQAAKWTKLSWSVLPPKLVGDLKARADATPPGTSLGKWTEGARGRPAPPRGASIRERLLALPSDVCVDPIRTRSVAAGGRDIEVLGAIRLPSAGFGVKLPELPKVKARDVHVPKPSPPTPPRPNPPDPTPRPRPVHSLDDPPGPHPSKATNGDPLAPIDDPDKGAWTPVVPVEPAFKRERLEAPSTTSIVDEATGHRVISVERGSATLAKLRVAPHATDVTFDFSAKFEAPPANGEPSLVEAIHRNEIGVTASAIVDAAGDNPVKFRAAFEAARNDIEAAALTALVGSDVRRATTLLDLARNGLGGTPRESLIRSLCDIESGLLLDRPVRMDGLESPALDTLRRAGLSDDDAVKVYSGETHDTAAGAISAVAGEGRFQVQLRLGRGADGTAVGADGLTLDVARAKIVRGAAFYVDARFGWGRHEIEAMGEEVVGVVARSPEVAFTMIDLPIGTFEPDVLANRDHPPATDKPSDHVSVGSAYRREASPGHPRASVRRSRG